MDSGADTIGKVETELLTLVRHLETVGRKSSLYSEIDRAGYLALRTLERLGPAHTNALAEALHLDASTVTRQVNALVAGGYVARRPDPSDRRSSILELTPDGTRSMGKVERERKQLLGGLLADWKDAERGDLGRALGKLNASLATRAVVLRGQGDSH
jgi:DNA-binding MarR family transcriptional regulator